MLCCTPPSPSTSPLWAPLEYFVDTIYPTILPYFLGAFFIAMVSTLAIKGSKRLLVVKILSLLMMIFIPLAFYDVPFFKDIANLIATASKATSTAVIDNTRNYPVLNVALFMFMFFLALTPMMLMPFMPFLVTLLSKPQGRYQMVGVQTVQWLTYTFTALTVIFLFLMSIR